LSVPKGPFAFRVCGSGSRHVNIARQALLLAAESEGVIALDGKTISESNAIEPRQSGIFDRFHFRKFYFRPIIMAGAFEAPHSSFGRFGQSAQVNINQIPALKAAQRPKPVVIIVPILEPGPENRALA